MVYDVGIIGAGVAGSRLAWLLGECGYNVLLLEKNEEIKRDTGVVSCDIKNIIPLKENLIKYKIKEMKFISPSGYEFTLHSNKPFCYILKRDKFGKWLRREAEKRCELVYEEFKNMRITDSEAKIKTKNSEYKAKMIVGADGALSKVRACLGIRKPKIFFGAMHPGKKIDDKPAIWFNKKYSQHFFAWFSPPNEYGLITKRDIKEKFKHFTKDRNILFSVDKLYARPIPIGFVKSFSYRAILIGDACGQVKPVTGGGIVFSLLAARIAAKTIRKGIKENNFSSSMLAEYEKRWKSLLANEIRFQLLLRRIFSLMNNRQIDGFFKEFGKEIENINNFNYDRIISLFKQIRKEKFLKYIVRFICQS